LLLSPSGSTGLQRFYRVLCSTGKRSFTDHWPRLLELVEQQLAFHFSARNHAGQTLLHTICSEATYTNWYTISGSFIPCVDQLCEMLQRAGADFLAPDNNGRWTATT